MFFLLSTRKDIYKCPNWSISFNLVAIDPTNYVSFVLSTDFCGNKYPILINPADILSKVPII